MVFLQQEKGGIVNKRITLAAYIYIYRIDLVVCLYKRGEPGDEQPVSSIRCTNECITRRN